MHSMDAGVQPCELMDCTGAYALYSHADQWFHPLSGSRWPRHRLKHYLSVKYGPSPS